MPHISVVLPVRNAMPYLPETLDSLVHQTYADFEVLVQDDGSSDETPDVVRSLADRDPRFLLVSDPQRGVVAATNAAHARAQGRLFVRIDGDDVATPDRIEKLVSFSSEFPDVGLFGSLVEYFPREFITDGLRHYETWLNGCRSHTEIMFNRYVEMPVAQPSWAMRREVFEEVGPYEHGPFPEDYEFFLRCAKAGVRFGKVPEVLHRYRDHPDRMSRNDSRYFLESFFELKARFLVPELQEDGRPIAVAGAGADGKRWARRLTQAGLDVRYFIEVHPGRIGQKIHGIDVIGYDELSVVRECFVLSAVGKKGGRDAVRAQMEVAGFHEGTDYLCVQ